MSYANDWFLLPVTVPVGSIVELEGLMVTDVFGDKLWIEAASGSKSDKEWDKWSLFNSNLKRNRSVPADLSFPLLPTAAKVMEGRPLEEVCFVKDEVANMVWAVETIVPLPTGKGQKGHEVSLEYRNKLKPLIQPEERAVSVENEAKIAYRLINDNAVPENWIPFIAVHKDSGQRQIQIQRAALPRIFKGDSSPPAKIEPRTSLLRFGLDRLRDKGYSQYFINEEEIPRAGVKIQKAFQRTR